MLEWSPESIWARPREAASGLQSISSVSSHSSDEPGPAWHLLNRQDLSLLFIRDVALIIACATTVFVYTNRIYIYILASLYIHRNGPVYLVHGLRGKEAGGAVSPPV